MQYDGVSANLLHVIQIPSQLPSFCTFNANFYSSGIEFQLRNPHHEVFTDLNTGRPGLSFPLPMDEKLAQGDAFRKSREKLKAELEEIDRYFSSPEAGCHTGPLNCSVCDQKKGKLIRAFCDYYLSTEPGTWTLDYPHFREHLQLRLNEPDPSLEAVHSIFTARLRHHLKNEHCTPHVSDLPSTTTMKRILLNMFMEGEPIPSILNFYLSDLEGRVSETEAAQFVAAMQKTKTPEDRARLYVLYYCSNGPNDPPVLRDFKEKYTRIFEALVPHDEVLVAMRKEAQDYQAKNVQHVQQLEERLGALELGKKAHLKKEQRKNARNGGDVTEQVVNCSLDGCPIEINLMTEEVIECVICEWMAEKGGMDGERRERAVYCSVEHAEDDFVSIIFC